MSKAFCAVQQFMLRHLEESTNSLCSICYLDIVYYVLEMIEWPSFGLSIYYGDL